ncbi:MAG: hypothetical protein UY64_C0055G0006 [Parcubacteria group bacterium GW2011_GWA1_51_12]|nr:MAG: hypothetical protein UY64_C0055G0006 [Parcubacteria group bacterium GW2011_GWA1_51_12]
MNLKKFIEKLKQIKKEHGENLEVVMADNIPTVEPIFSDKYLNVKKVVITDQK